MRGLKKRQKGTESRPLGAWWLGNQGLGWLEIMATQSAYFLLTENISAGDGLVWSHLVPLQLQAGRVGKSFDAYRVLRGSLRAL